MRKVFAIALVSVLVAGSALADTTKLTVTFKGGAKTSNKGSATFGITAEGTDPYGNVVLQASKDGVSGWKNVSKPIALSSEGTATKRLSNSTVTAVGSYVRASTYGQNKAPVHSVAKKEPK